MNKKIFLKSMLAGMVALSFAACSEPDDEVTSINYKRNFSPVNLEARVVNQTQIRMIWSVVEGATSYNIEVYNDSMQFAGTPKTTFSVTNDQLPYTITGLEGEEWYSIRVQAITEGNDARTSKWAAVAVETGREQIFKDVLEEDLTCTSVTLRWPAGERADYITVTPGNIRHNLTDNEIAAGAATIDGLTDDTEYKAVMTYRTKTRGTVTFTTPLDLGGAIKVEADQSLTEAIANAADGDVLALMPGTFAIAAGEDAAYNNGSLKITKSITLRSAKSSDRAIIKGRITLENGASLDLNQVIIDATETDGGQIFNFTAEGEFDHLNIQDCEIIGASGQKGFCYVNVAAAINNITINNCLIRDIECNGGDLFDSRKGYIKSFTLTNSTLWKCATSRDIFRYDDASGSFPGVEAPNFTVDHCTFVDCGNGNANYRFFYLRFAGNKITFTNNLVTGFNNKRGFANQASTDQAPTLSGNYYWNTLNLVSPAEGNTEKISWFDEEGQNHVEDPGFADAANGDFTVSNEEIKYRGAGDPRWIK